MKYVLDSSVALKWVLPEVDADKADRFLGQDLIAPDIFSAEVGHALSKSHRQGKLTQEEATLALTTILDSRPALYPASRLMWRGFEISLIHRCAFYDSLYVALAERENVEFVTADQKLLHNLATKFPFIRALSEF